MNNAIIYARFSPRPKKEGAPEIESNQTQIEYCRRLATESSYEVAGVFEDQYKSGDDADRAGLWQAVEALGRGDVLLVYKRDRLARDVYLTECIRRAVEAKGASIEAVSGDIEGDGPEVVMVRQVMAAIAEYEKKLIAIRTKHAMLRHQSSGRRMSCRLPYGFRLDPERRGRMIEEPAEQEAICKMRELYDQGLGVRDIARKLGALGYLPRAAKEWSHRTVSQILVRKD